MNKLAYIIITCFVLCVVSCTQDEKDIFGDSSANRMNAALKECNDILVGSGNGWVLEYYPEEHKYGGFHLYLTFSGKGEVTITTESALLKFPNERTTSQYQLKADMGPVLSFDTYNRVLHQFSDPNPDGLGFEGDYEFIILKADQDKVELKGKKNGVKMQMVPLPVGTTWNEYSTEVDQTTEKFPGFTMRLDINGIIVDTEESGGIGRYLTFKLPDGTDSSAQGVPYMYTSTGVKFKESVTIAGRTMQNFKAAEDGKSLYCVDKGAEDVSIVQMPLAEAFVSKKGNWFFDPQRMGDRYTTLWNNIVMNLDEKGNEELVYVYLRASYGYLSLISYARDDNKEWPASFYIDLTPVEGNLLRMSCPGGGDEIARYFYYDYFRYLLSYMSSYNPYALEFDNSKIPNEITFRRVDSPEKIWFVVSK